MYFKRKIDKELDDWYSKENRSPALIVGIRQCGKTESVHAFAKRNKLQLIEVNFWNRSEFCSDFDNQDYL